MTLLEKLRHLEQRRCENAWLRLIVALAFMWIFVIARLGYLLATGRL